MTNTAINPSVTPFQFNTIEVRTLEISNSIWFVAADVCAVLEIKNVTQAISRLDEDERAMFNIGRDTLCSNEGNNSGNPNVNCINESGLYSLVLSSRKAEAKAFKKWVTSEVLPSIRRTGKYEAPNLKTKKAIAGGLRLEQCDIIKEMVKARIDACPRELKAKAAKICWGSIKRKFGCTYKAVPPEYFSEMVSLVERVVIEGEFIAKGEQEQPRVSAQNKMPTRHLLFIDMDGRQQIAPIAENAYILTADQILTAVKHGEMPDIDLPMLIATAGIRLAKLAIAERQEARAR
jgi:prophage antirepressor-like protein